MTRRALALIAAIAAPTMVYAQADQAPPPPPPPQDMPGAMGGVGQDMPGGFGGPGGMMPPGMHMEKQAYLGVETSPADPALAAQLKAPAGSGLVVNFVADDSPAKKAGLERLDVITKVDDQVLFNPPQLQGLIRAKKAGDEVKLTVARAGETKTLTAKLTEHEQPAGFGPGMPGMPGMGMPAMGMGMSGMGMGMGPQWQTRSLTIGDGKNKLELKNDSGQITLTATGENGEKLFEGPIETKEQRAKMPDNVKQMLADGAIDHMVRRMKSAPGFDAPQGGDDGRMHWGPPGGQGRGPGGGMGQGGPGMGRGRGMGPGPGGNGGPGGQP